MKIALLTTDNREPFRQYDNPQPWFDTAPEALLQGFALWPEAEIHVVSCAQQPMVSSPEKLAPNIWFHSLAVAKIGWLRTGYQGCIRAVRKKLREIRPDIVHGQGTERDCAMSAVFSGFPNVITIHGNMNAVAKFFHAPPGSFHWLAARLETFALHRTMGTFCNSTYTETQVAPRTPQTWRAVNPVRQIFFEAPVSRPTKNTPIFLNVGTLTPYKRQREILALFGRLWQRGLKFELQFAGSREGQTDYDKNFARELTRAEQAGYARHLGMLSANQLIAAMDNADALIHAPVEEAFGLVVAEALARNLKFFGSTAGGIEDIAGDA